MEGQDGAPPLMVGTGKDDVHLLIVATAERGLCGGFNSSIARKAREFTRELQKRNKTIKILCIGKKGFDALRMEFGPIIIDRVDIREIKQMAFSDADVIGKKVLGLFDSGEFDVATLFYSEYKSIISQIPQAQQIIPPQISTGDDGADSQDVSYDYEPDENEILDDLLPRNVSVQIFRALLENGASEQGARMSAMDNATRNAGEMIDNLTISYNRQRQAQITKELIEIISGAEAL